LKDLTILNAVDLQKIIAVQEQRLTRSKKDKLTDVLATEVQKYGNIYTAHYTEIVAHAT
jgi:hypothetical protein